MKPHYGHLLRHLHCCADQAMTGALASMELTAAQGHIMGYIFHRSTAPCARDIEEAFLEICRRFDVQRPLQLPKHNREFEQFGRTFYAREHFTESIDFDKLEIEYIQSDGTNKKSGGPRTPLMDA